MKAETRYQYKKRIKELKTEVEGLRSYKSLCIEIFFAVTQMVQEGKTVNQGWLLAKFRDIFR